MQRANRWSNTKSKLFLTNLLSSRALGSLVGPSALLKELPPMKKLLPWLRNTFTKRTPKSPFKVTNTSPPFFNTLDDYFPKYENNASLKSQLARYVHQAQPPPLFLMFMLANDLKMATTVASHSEMKYLKSIYDFIRINVPAEAQGSMDNITAWMGQNPITPPE